MKKEMRIVRLGLSIVITYIVGSAILMPTASQSLVDFGFLAIALTWVIWLCSSDKEEVKTEND